MIETWKALSIATARRIYVNLHTAVQLKHYHAANHKMLRSLY